jgi:hypothetical protein
MRRCRGPIPPSIAEALREPLVLRIFTENDDRTIHIAIGIAPRSIACRATVREAQPSRMPAATRIAIGEAAGCS